MKDKAEDFGEKAKEGFEAAKDKASDLIDDVKDRFDNDDSVTSSRQGRGGTGLRPERRRRGLREGIAAAAAGAEPTLESAAVRWSRDPNRRTPAAEP